MFSAILSLGGRWVDLSPIRSGPEGSSRNDLIKAICPPPFFYDEVDNGTRK